MDMTSSLFSS